MSNEQRTTLEQKQSKEESYAKAIRLLYTECLIMVTGYHGNRGKSPKLGQKRKKTLSISRSCLVKVMCDTNGIDFP